LAVAVAGLALGMMRLNSWSREWVNREDGVETAYGRGREHGWLSRCFGQIEEASYAVARVRGVGTLRLQATIVLNP